MATGGKLEVQIGADKTDFDKKIKEVEFDIQQLSKVKLEKIRLGLDTTEINSQIKDAKNNLNQLKSAVKDSGQSFNNFKPAVANGGNALMQFSRIAQDAPFGIIGIGNNLTATAEAFSALKNQTGSAGGALKAIGSSILGSGGILLGVSLLTTGLTYLAQSGLSVGDVIDKITGNFDEFTRSIQKANEEAAKTSGSEIANLKALVSVAQDETKSRQDRLIAVRQLQKEFPAYFGNLATENILNGNLTGTVKELTKAIIERAKASAFSSKIGELAQQEVLLNNRLNNEINDIAKSYKLSKDEAEKFRQEVLSGANVFKLLDPFKKRVGIFDLAGAVASSNAIKDIRQDLIQNEAWQNKYTKAIERSTSASIKLQAETPAVVKKKKTKNKFDFEPGFIAPFVSSISGLGDTMAGFEERTKIAFENASASVKGNTDKMKAALADFNNQVNDLITNSIASTFTNLGEAIGSALVSGGDVLSSIGQGLIASLSSFLSQLGDKLITYGLLLAGFGKAELAFAVGDPVTKIGAGLAMVALGVAAKAAGAAVSSFGGGGLRGGGVSGSSGSGANNSSFTNSGFASSGGGGGTVVFEIAGTKLIGVLSNTINSNKRLGGQLGLG